MTRVGNKVNIIDQNRDLFLTYPDLLEFGTKRENEFIVELYIVLPLV